MKKIYLSIMLLLLFATSGFCTCPCNQVQEDLNCQKKQEIITDVNKCIEDDDEYCVYNECYFDKRYKKMKQKLCLTESQECKIDSLYKKFKDDMEILHSKYRTQKNKILEMIDCSNKCYKEEINELKSIKKDIKDRYKCFKNDVKNQLCKSQIKTYNKYNRKEKRRIKKIVKYGAIYKFPCKNCCEQ